MAPPLRAVAKQKMTRSPLRVNFCVWSPD